MAQKDEPLSPRRPQNERTCCGVIEEATTTAREKRENRTKPQPWIVRKLMVGITLGIMGYTAYVYIAQLCLPMIRRRSGAPASRGTGIALLSVFSVLYLLMLWAYVKVCITPPGYAKDYIQKTGPPLIPADGTSYYEEGFGIVSHEQDTRDVELGQPDHHHTRNPSVSATTAQSHISAERRRHDSHLGGPSYEDILKREGAPQPPSQSGEDSNAGVLDALPRPNVPAELKPGSPNPGHSAASSTLETSDNQQQANPKLKKSRVTTHSTSAGAQSPNLKTNYKARREQRLKIDAEREQVLDRLNVYRKPPTTPILQPIHRYCGIDEIVKPYRTHHCRACGTCVLKYDHHCPWIGQCVGARNHKFFINFCIITSIFTAFVFGTVVAYTVKTATSRDLSDDLDPRSIVLIALAGLFFIFTLSLWMSHVHLTLHGQTTVESMHIRSMKEREEHKLARGFAWYEFGAKKRRRQQWDEEWGVPSTEGNIWWRGNKYEEWVDVMGTSWVGWLLPIGRGQSDGLSYPVNPRFDADGRWRRRAEWPEELR